MKTTNKFLILAAMTLHIHIIRITFGQKDRIGLIPIRLRSRSPTSPKHPLETFKLIYFLLGPLVPVARIVASSKRLGSCLM